MFSFGHETNRNHWVGRKHRYPDAISLRLVRLGLSAWGRKQNKKKRPLTCFSPLRKYELELWGLVVCTFDPSIWAVEAGWFFCLKVRACLKQQKQTKEDFSIRILSMVVYIRVSSFSE